MIGVLTVLCLGFWHWIADFVFQTHTMATRKSSSVYWLTMHVATYTAVMAIGASSLEVLAVDPDWIGVALFVAVTMVLHWMVDYVTSKMTSRLWAEQRVHDFFVVVGFDQLLHLVSLVGAYYLILG